MTFGHEVDDKRGEPQADYTSAVLRLHSAAEQVEGYDDEECFLSPLSSPVGSPAGNTGNRMNDGYLSVPGLLSAALFGGGDAQVSTQNANRHKNDLSGAAIGKNDNAAFSHEREFHCSSSPAMAAAREAVVKAAAAGGVSLGGVPVSLAKGSATNTTTSPPGAPFQ
jgi:hypothetical protein